MNNKNPPKKPIKPTLPKLKPPPSPVLYTEEYVKDDNYKKLFNLIGDAKTFSAQELIDLLQDIAKDQEASLDNLFIKIYSLDHYYDENECNFNLSTQFTAENPRYEKEKLKYEKYLKEREIQKERFLKKEMEYNKKLEIYKKELIAYSKFQKEREKILKEANKKIKQLDIK